MENIGPEAGGKTLSLKEEKALDKREGKKRRIIDIVEICSRRMVLCAYVGGGLGGLGLFGATDLGSSTFGRAPDLFVPLFYTFALLSGFCLAYAYTEYDWKGVKLNRDHPGREAQQETIRWKPRSAEVFYRLAYLFLSLTALCLMVAAWWAWWSGSSPVR